MKKKKVAKAKATRNLPSKVLSAKQAKSVKGGGSTVTKIPGRLKWESITLKRGQTSE